MSTHEKKPRAHRVSTKSPTKSPIATPPRTFQGRSKTLEQASNESSSSTSTAKPSANANTNTPDTNSPSSSPEDDAVTPSVLLARKDKKISELEKEIATMEDEFEAELTRLSHKITNETETAQFWQHKHSALNQSYLKTDTDLRLLRQEVEGGKGEGALKKWEEREKDFRTRVSSLMLDRDAFREAYNEAMGELRGKDERVRELMGQVRGLKSWVSREGKAMGGEQVSDEVVGERSRGLGNGVQNWVISHFRRAKFDLSKLDEETKEQLLQLVPTYETLAISSKVHFIQSLMSRILVTHIFSAYFIGLPKEQEDEFARVEASLNNFGTTESINQWRSTTLSIIHKSATQNLSNNTTRITTTIVNMVNHITDSISDIPHTEARDASLKTLVNSSIELARLMRIQKAAFKTMMPSIEGHQRTLFDGEEMEDIGGEDEDGLEEREIRCVVFFGVVKWGDENGERGHLRNVVSKVRVLCAPD